MNWLLLLRISYLLTNQISTNIALLKNYLRLFGQVSVR